MNTEAIKLVGVVGLGTVGTGISQLLAQYGYSVVALDLSEEVLHRGLDVIRSGRFGVEAAVQKGKLDPDTGKRVLERIRTSTQLSDMRSVQFVIENVYEDLTLKRKVFSQLDEICPSDVVLATDTSSLSITEIATDTKHPERVVGMHFFNPPQVMKLVELIRGVRTSDETVDLTKRLAQKLEREPILVKDSPGFAAARLGLALFVEASKVLEEGVANVKDIDACMKLGFGQPMGPFELTDLIGLDTRRDILESMYLLTGEARWKPPLLLRQLVSAGYTGDRKTRKSSLGGYYEYFRLK